MNVLVTGSAGFIGSALCLRLLARGDSVIGIDNHNDYYDPQLKEDRLARQLDEPGYVHYRVSLQDRDGVAEVFAERRPDRVVHLAAQAGVRYSLENPLAYIDSNLVGFAHVLECCRQFEIEHLVYASSSSVYGSNTRMPYSVHDPVDHPISLYAATKKSNELTAHTYSHLYRLPTTGLRFFTVYGPWDRPDMALQKFANCIVRGEPIKLFNHGNHRRDFTYIDDVVEAVVRVLDVAAAPDPDWNSDQPDCASSNAPWRIYNIGSHNPVALLTYVSELERAIGKKARKEFLPLQPGDVPDTYADIEALSEQFDFRPTTTIREGIEAFASWFLDYYK